VLAPFAARPHWGKEFQEGAETLAGRCPRLSEFLALRRELDPGETFVNGWLTEKLPVGD
jgi:alditol oxidase